VLYPPLGAVVVPGEVVPGETIPDDGVPGYGEVSGYEEFPEYGEVEVVPLELLIPVPLL